MSVLLLGRGDDPVLAHLRRRAEALGTPCEFVDAALVAAEGSWDLELPGGGGELRCGAEVWDLSAYSAIITRNLEPGAAGGPTPTRWAGFVDSVGPWLRTCPLAVANPPPPRWSAPAQALARMALADTALPAADWRWACPMEPAPRTAGPGDGGSAARVYVVGDAALPSPAGSGAGRLPAPEVQSALADATARLGWLLARWEGTVDRDGVWRSSGADPAPDFRLDDRLLDGALSRRLLGLRSRPPARRAPACAVPAPGTPDAAVLRGGACRTGLDPCPCGSPSSIPVLDRLLAEAGALLDRGLRAAERWRGPMRRESLRYGTAQEHARYEEAFNRVARDAQDGALAPLTVDRLRALHRWAGGDGELRTVHLWIPGGHTFPHPGAVGPLLEELCAAYEEGSSWAVTAPRAGYSSALQLHLGLLTIHPFRDGNGRLSRLVAARELMRRGYRSRPLTILDQHYERWPHVYTALLVGIEEGRICRPACVLGMQLAALAGAWRAAPSLARTQAPELGPCVQALGEGGLGQILAPVLAELTRAGEDR